MHIFTLVNPNNLWFVRFLNTHDTCTKLASEKQPGASLFPDLGPFA